MGDLGQSLGMAWQMIWSLEDHLVQIVLLSLKVSLTAVGIASVIAAPLGAALALFKFPGRRVLVILINTLMGLPPVVVGLVLYLLLSRAGPLGALGLLYSPTAMIIAQVILVTPIIAALTRNSIESLWGEYEEQLRSLGCRPLDAVPTLLWDGRFQLVTGILAGFGRASAEVGVVMIVGGNIDHVTRVMTTAIALEVSKGDLALALGLGMVLLMLSLGVNALVAVLRDVLERRYA